MPLADFDGSRLPAAADFNAHLRDGAMLELVVPTIRQGGTDMVLQQPTINPPITTVSAALAYRRKLFAIDPNVTYLMSLYLDSSITPETIVEAKAAGVAAVKCYPSLATTDMANGIVDYSIFYPIFAEMERQDMALNLHGECPSTPYRAPPKTQDSSTPQAQTEPVTILNAEERFLPTLLSLHRAFPKLRIVLASVSTAAGVKAIEGCGPTVAGTITAHHLLTTVDDWAGNPHNFCRPVAKLPSDQAALLQAATSGNPKFFFGSDSAPHSIEEKGKNDKRQTAAAGVFTQPYASQLVLDALASGIASGMIEDERVTKAAVHGFLHHFGRKFYDVESEGLRHFMAVQRGKSRETIPEMFHNDLEDIKIVPFRAGERTWLLQWERIARAGIILY